VSGHQGATSQRGNSVAHRRLDFAEASNHSAGIGSPDTRRATWEVAVQDFHLIVVQSVIGLLLCATAGPAQQPAATKGRI
jgi:hypothetical protein